jgi:hypothetical protein
LATVHKNKKRRRRRVKVVQTALKGHIYEGCDTYGMELAI